MNDDVIFAFLNDELTPAEKREVENWIGLSDKNRRVFERVKFIWDHSRADYSNVEVDLENAWQSIQRRSRSNRWAVKYFRIAASIAVLLGMGYLSYRIVNHNVSPGQEWITLATASDRNDVELPDGSHVWLNHHSSVAYPVKFRFGIREIELSGEAFFEVMKNKRKPFVVKSESSLVEVLGTSFNVESDLTLAEEVTVTVVTGKVALSELADPANILFLEPGEKGTYDLSNNRIRKTVNDNRNFMAWKTGILVFENSSVDEVCSILSGHYGIPVSTDPRGGLDMKRLTATYDNKDLGEVLDILSLTLDIKYESEDEGIILFPSIP